MCRSNKQEVQRKSDTVSRVFCHCSSGCHARTALTPAGVPIPGSTEVSKLVEGLREAATAHEGIEELSKVSSGRLTELFLPLYQVTPSKYRKEILNYVQNLRQERTREMGLSEEVLVLASILDCEKQGMTQKGLILIKHITERINKQSDYKEQYSNQQLGQIIGRLGFEKQHTRQGNALVWNENLIKKLESDPRYENCFKPVEVSDQYPTEGSRGSQGSQLNYFEDTENSENKN